MVTYSCERSEKKTSVSAPSPGSTTSYSTSSPATALGQRGCVVAGPPPRRADLDVLDADVERQRRRVRAAPPPTACAIRPQFGSPPCSAALTSGELATARATRSTTSSVAAAHDHAADPLGALAVAHDRAARACAARVQRLAEAQLVVGLGRDAHAAGAARPAGSRCRWWRAARRRRCGRTSARRTRRAAGRRSRAPAPRRSARSRASSRSAGEIIPAPLACAVSRTVPDGSATSSLDLFGERVGGADRLREVVVAVLRAARRARRARPRMTSRRRAARRSRRSRRRRPGPRHAARPSRPRPACGRRPRSRGGRSRRWRCRSWRRRRADASRRVRSSVSSTGAARTPERVNRAAVDAVRRRADHQADVEAAARLQPARDACRAEARAADPPALSVTCRGRSSQRD